MNEERILLTCEDFKHLKKHLISVGVEDEKIPGKIFYVTGKLTKIDAKKLLIAFERGGFKLINIEDVQEIRVPA